jgi:hypothetical protein
LQPKKERITTTAEFSGGVYSLTLERTILGNHRYVDFAKVERILVK